MASVIKMPRMSDTMEVGQLVRWLKEEGDEVAPGEGIAEVETVIPNGVTPHDFEPSLADRGALEDAALVVVNGAGLEECLGDFQAELAALADRVGVAVVTLRTGSLGESGSGADTYITFLRSNAELIAAALASPS